MVDQDGKPNKLSNLDKNIPYAGQPAKLAFQLNWLNTLVLVKLFFFQVRFNYFPKYSSASKPTQNLLLVRAEIGLCALRGQSFASEQNLFGPVQAGHCRQLLTSYVDPYSSRSSTF